MVVTRDSTNQDLALHMEDYIVYCSGIRVKVLGDILGDPARVLYTLALPRR